MQPQLTNQENTPVSSARVWMQAATTHTSRTQVNMQYNENLSSHADMHAHAGSTLHNAVTLIFNLRVNAWRGPAIQHMCTKFGVGSSSRFPFRARTYSQTHKATDAADHPTDASATAGRRG